MISIKPLSLVALLATVLLVSCEQFDEFNANPNEPTEVSADVLMTAALRSSVNTMVTESFLLGNNAAQLTAKTLRTEVDAYNWNAFPTVWEGLYESLTDVNAVERIALEQGNEKMQGAAMVVRAWVFSTLTNAYGDIPYFEAIKGGTESNFTPAYDEQAVIYADLLDQLAQADALLAPEAAGSISGDIIYNGSAAQWRKLANSLRLRLLMAANNQLADAGAQFAEVVEAGNIMESNEDNAALVYLDGFPNQFPLIPLKTGDFDAVAISQNAVNLLSSYDDPRLFRYARPDNGIYGPDGTFDGAENGAGAGSCDKIGSRLGPAYFVDGAQTTADQLGIELGKGIIMTYAELEFLLAEAAEKGWIGDDVESHYRAGIAASMGYHQVSLDDTQWESFDDFYANSGVAYTAAVDIWEQKWVALFFHGLEPYFELRRWYFESGNDWAGLPFVSPPCANVNDDMLPMRFLYPGEEQSLNSDNYSAAVQRLGGSNSQNAAIWLVK